MLQFIALFIAYLLLNDKLGLYWGFVIGDVAPQ